MNVNPHKVEATVYRAMNIFYSSTQPLCYIDMGGVRWRRAESVKRESAGEGDEQKLKKKSFSSTQKLFPGER